MKPITNDALATLLMEEAKRVRENAYVPYSGFAVGAALLTTSGKIYTGCNVESASFSPTCCAERTAFFKAVSEGERTFVAIAVTGGKKEDPPVRCTPCGVCRQVMAEFCSGDFTVYLGSPDQIEEYRLNELLPFSFGGEMLEG